MSTNITAAIYLVSHYFYIFPLYFTDQFKIYYLTAFFHRQFEQNDILKSAIDEQTIKKKHFNCEHISDCLKWRVRNKLAQTRTENLKVLKSKVSNFT